MSLSDSIGGFTCSSRKDVLLLLFGMMAVQCYRHVLNARLHKVALLQYFGLHLQTYKGL